MTSVIAAKGLTKHYGKFCSVNNVSFEIPSGRIVGLIGPNGSGKTTTLKSILGLIPFEGELSVLGLDPRTQRDELMQSVSFIADVAVLPGWLRVRDAVDFVEGVHPKFSREKAERYLSKTNLKPAMKVREMSKGMVVQLHLSLIMAIDAQLLVLDEPTLGLDLLYRRAFHQSLLEEYFDESRTIIVSTHQVEEIEHVLSDVMFIRDGQLILFESMERMGERFAEVQVSADGIDAARALNPISEKSAFGKTTMLFDGVDRDKLEGVGQACYPSLADVFVAKMQGESNENVQVAA